jgi:hypothetical protein
MLTEKPHARLSKKPMLADATKRRLAMLLLAVVLVVLVVSFLRMVIVTPAATTDVKKPLPPMEQAEIDQAEKDFLVYGINYAQSAITASQYVSSRTSDAEVKKYAESIVESQTKDMWYFIGEYQLKFQENAPPAEGSEKKFPSLVAYSGEDLDRNYLQNMADYHSVMNQKLVDLAIKLRETATTDTFTASLLKHQENTKLVKTMLDKYNKK